MRDFSSTHAWEHCEGDEDKNVQKQRLRRNVGGSCVIKEVELLAYNKYPLFRRWFLKSFLKKKIIFFNPILIKF